MAMSWPWQHPEGSTLPPENTEMFHFTRSARHHSSKRLLQGLALTILGCLLSLFWWALVVGVAGFMMLAVGGYMVLASLAQLVVGGRWEIVADSRGLGWRAPRGVDQSFHVSLQEIERLEVRRAVKGGGQASARYWLMGPDSQERELSAISGVDLAKLADALRSLEVEVTDVRVL